MCSGDDTRCLAPRALRHVRQPRHYGKPFRRSHRLLGPAARPERIQRQTVDQREVTTVG
jgi:hypothetical protein